MNPYNNFVGYRTHIKSIRPPVIFCTGKLATFLTNVVEILLKDLLYQNEGSANFVDKELSTYQ